MKYRVTLAIALLMGAMATIYAQQLRRNEAYLDSLQTVLNSEISQNDRATTLYQVGKYHQYLDSAKALKILEELIPLASESEDRRLLADTYFLKAGIFRRHDTRQLSLNYLTKAQELFWQESDTLWATLMKGEMARLYTFYFNDRDTSNYLLKEVLQYIKGRGMGSREAWCYDMIANNYRREDNHFKALEYLQKSYDLRAINHDTTNMAKKLANMGNIHFVMDNYEKAISCYRQSIGMLSALEPDLNTNLWLKSNNLNIGMALMNQEKIEEAFPYLMLADSLKDHARGKRNSNLIYSIGEYFFEKGQLDSAEYRYAVALKLSRKNNTITVLPKILRGVASVHLANGNVQAALSYAEESMALARKHSQPDHLSEGHKLISDVYATLGIHAKAYEHLMDYHELSDSLMNEDKIRSITTLENRFEFQNEKKAIAQAQKEKELLLQAEIDQRQLVQNSLIAGLILVMIIAFIAFRFYQIKKRDNQQIQQQTKQLQHTNEELQQLSIYKQGLTQMIAHDMKNPLNVIISLASNSKKKENMQEVVQSGKLMLQMVHNMLDIQRFEETKMHLNKGHHSLNELIIRAKYQVELLLMAKSIEFVNKVEENATIMGDADLIIRIIVNLYTNAIKYMNIGGKLTMEVRKLDGRHQVSVADTGKGISEELQEHIFDKFWQSDPKKYGVTTSNGLGLTFCKLAVMAHGGEISVSSKEKEGSTFYFDLEAGDAELVSHKSILIETHPESTLTNKDQEQIRTISDRLKQVPIYNSSKIEALLRELESYHSPGLDSWKIRLREASYSFDNEAFEELINE